MINLDLNDDEKEREFRRLRDINERNSLPNSIAKVIIFFVIVILPVNLAVHLYCFDWMMSHFAGGSFVKYLKYSFVQFIMAGSQYILYWAFKNSPPNIWFFSMWIQVWLTEKLFIYLEKLTLDTRFNLLHILIVLSIIISLFSGWHNYLEGEKMSVGGIDSIISFHVRAFSRLSAIILQISR